jgi:hypothetical protein
MIITKKAMKNIFILLVFSKAIFNDNGNVFIEHAKIKNNTLEIRFCNNSDQKAAVPYLHYRIDPKNIKFLYKGFYSINHDTLFLNFSVRLDSSYGKPRISDNGGNQDGNYTAEFVDKTLNPHDCFTDRIAIDATLDGIKNLMLHYDKDTYFYKFK